MSERPRYIGGLMRCCIQTLNEYAGPETEDFILPCQYCKSEMIIKHGAWQWNREPYQGKK